MGTGKATTFTPEIWKVHVRKGMNFTETGCDWDLSGSEPGSSGNVSSGSLMV